MTATATNLKMMTGSGGHEDYLVVARKGNMVFGIKPLAAVPGKMKGVPGTTYFLSRIRVAPAGGLFEEEDAQTNVVAFKQKFQHPKEAWPNITWEKKAVERVSSIYSVFVKGTLGEGADLQQALIDAIADKKIGKKFAEHLTEALGKDSMVITVRQLTDYVDKQFTDVIHAFIEKEAEAKALQEAAFANLEDTFGVESDVLKKLYAKINPQAEIEDVEEAEGDSDPDADQEECPEEHDNPDAI